MKLTIDSISAFVSLVHFGNYQTAAASLKVTQPALTRRIQRLEDALGAQLIDRRYRGVSLTALGTNYLPIAIRTVHDFNRSNQQIKDLVSARTGTVKLAMNMTIATTILPNILKAFSELHPNVSVKITEGSGPNVVEKVLSGEVEFGIAPCPTSIERIDFEECYSDPFMLVAHRDHELHIQPTVTWQCLEKYNFIKMRPESGTRRLLEKGLDDLGVHLTGQYEVGHLPALLSLVGHNLGVSAVPDLSSTAIHNLPIISRKINGPAICRSIGILTSQDSSLSPAALALKTIAKNVLEAQKF
jgi:DNA-binding transcriptional LysR family regulator